MSLAIWSITVARKARRYGLCLSTMKKVIATLHAAKYFAEAKDEQSIIFLPDKLDNGNLG